MNHALPSRSASPSWDSPSVEPISSIARGFTRVAICGTTAYSAGNRRASRSSGIPPGQGSSPCVSQMKNPANIASITGVRNAFFRFCFRLPPVTATPLME